MNKKFKLIRNGQVQNIFICTDPEVIELKEGEFLVECGAEKVRLGDPAKAPLLRAKAPTREITAEDVIIEEITLSEPQQEESKTVLVEKKWGTRQIITLAAISLCAVSSMLYFLLSGG